MKRSEHRGGKRERNRGRTPADPDRGTTMSAEPVATQLAGGGSLASPPYAWAALAAAAVGLLYVLTLAPTTAFWDTSEYIATAHIMGIPHPPGNPAFVILARAWELLLSPFGLPVAVRINLFSAVMSAMAHGLWFLVVHHILRTFTDDEIFPLVGAAAAVLVSATAFTVWNQSNVNEKVYTVTLFTIALLTWLAFHWREDLGRGKDDNLLVLMAFILALSVGNHLMAFLAAPALGLFILMVHPRTLANWKLYPAVLGVVLLGLSIHMFLPLRAALDPVINEADPTCPSVAQAVTSIVTWGQAGCSELSAALGRKQYDKPPMLTRLAPLHMQVANYLQYFDWQWARSLSGKDTVFPPLRMAFTILFTTLGIFGATEHYRRDRKTFWYLIILFGTMSAALVYYLNFKYGYSLAAPVADRNLHEVRERDYFFIVSFSLWGLWAGIGIAALWQTRAERPGVGWRRASPILGLAIMPLLLNWGWASRADDYSARDWAYNLLMSVEPYAVIFTNGDNDTFPLWYLQEVEGLRRDVTVIVTSYLNTEWYAVQIRELTRPCPTGVDPSEDPTRVICQRPYDDSMLPATYTHDGAAAERAGKIPILLSEPVRPPTRSTLELDDETMTRVAASFVPIRETQSVPLGLITATIPAGTILLPWHQFALSVINSSLEDRPIYFSSTTAAQQELGLGKYTVREGLAYRLYPGDPADSLPPGVLAMAPSPLSRVVGPWLARDRTAVLVNDVFVHRGGLPDEWMVWPDQPTVGIPNYYAWAYYALAQASAQEGDSATLDRYRERAETWTLLGR